MAYTEPPTFAGATTATAADANILSEDIRFLKSISDGVVFSGVQLTRATNQSIPNAVSTPIIWTVEAFDYGGWWASGATVTVPAGAIPAGFTTIAVLVVGRIRYASNATGIRRITVQKNASGSEGDRTTSALGGGDTTDTDIFEVVICEAGDTLTLNAYHTRGSALNAEVAQMTILRYAPVA